MTATRNQPATRGRPASRNQPAAERRTETPTATRRKGTPATGRAVGSPPAKRRKGTPATRVPERVRPSADRAAAAARLAGAPAEEKDVTERLAAAERRAKAAAASRASSGPSRLRAAIGGHISPAPSPARNPEPEERPRHLRVVEKKPRSAAQRQRRTRLLIVGGICAAAVVGLVLVYFHVVLAQRQFALDNLQTTVAKQQTTYQELRLQVAELNSPQRIITEAEGTLKMIQPTSVQYLTQPAATKAGAAQSTAGNANGLDEPTSGNLVQPASQAPPGDADWPRIKASLQGAP